MTTIIHLDAVEPRVSLRSLDVGTGLSTADARTPTTFVRKKKMPACITTYGHFITLANQGEQSITEIISGAR